MSSRFRIMALAGVVVVGLASSVTLAGAQSNQKPETFTAFAVNMSGVGPSGSGVVDLAIERWSSDAEREALRKVFVEKGPEKLLDALQDTKRVGYIRTPTSLGWDVRFVMQVPDEEGGRRIYALTDRRISFAEARNQPRTMDYPFTFIEIHLDKTGNGEGKASVATKITLNKKGQLELENYGTQPVLLTKVTAKDRK